MIALRAAGYSMVLCDTHDDPAIQDEYLLEMQAQFAVAFVLLAPVESPRLSAFGAAGAPLIFVNRRSPDDPDAPVIGIDNTAAAAEVAAELHGAGIRRVGLIHGPLHSSATRERVSGFRDAWSRLEPGPEVPVATDASADHMLIGYQAAGRLLAEGDPQALVCLSDLIAFGAHRRAGEMRRELAFFGFDDAPLNEWVAPWLSSVHIPYADFGPAIVRRLTETEPDGADIILPYDLRVRGQGVVGAGRKPFPAG